MKEFGLIGKKLGHSFSRSYFMEKFRRENILATYQNFELDDISRLKFIIEQYPGLAGLNVTLPYKQSVIPFLNSLDETAWEIGAVNTIAFRFGKTTGYNTDAGGFARAAEEFMKGKRPKEILILGNGGASKAVQYALRKILKWDLPFIVTRTPLLPGHFSWKSLKPEFISAMDLIINTTPIGMFPDVDQYPPIPFEGLHEGQYVFDLIYNPVKTELLLRAEAAGCKIENGLKMLHYQAELAWEIWGRK
jgi:shikimate dehydrogenase